LVAVIPGQKELRSLHVQFYFGFYRYLDSLVQLHITFNKGENVTDSNSAEWIKGKRTINGFEMFGP
jgi:hypothetical protein